MGKKNVIRKTRKMIAFLLAAAICVGFCTGFTANAQEAGDGTSQQTESKEQDGQAGQSREAELTGNDVPEGGAKKETGTQEIAGVAAGSDSGKAGTADVAKDTAAETVGKNEAGASETSSGQQDPQGNEGNPEAQQMPEQDEEIADAQDIAPLSSSGLSNPRIETDSSMMAGQKVTWDCVWFGSYPQAEVVSSANDYTAIDKSMLRSGDVIQNSSLYSKLQSVSGWNANNDIMVDGNKYRRMKKSDAIYTSSGSSYYNWPDSDTYHYFKYEPIKWRVLKVNGNQAFLLSDIALDDQQYNTASESITWETSTIRSWLNGYGTSSNKQGKDYSSKNFIGSAFSGGEKSAIVNSSVVNDDNISKGTEGGNNTTDKIFLLSESEVYRDSASLHGFVSSYSTYDEARRCKSSTYAKAMGTYGDTRDVYKGNCWWWLRSPGYGTNDAADVDHYGYVYNIGRDVDNDNDGVRAALNLNLSSNLYTYAGTVSSDGTENEVGGGSTEPEIPTSPTEKKYKENIIKALPNMNNLGSATLKGPEISIVGNKFNLFQTDMNMSLPFWDNVEIQADENKKTVKVLIGTKGKELSTENDDTYWTNTYKDVKSFVQKCGGTVDTTKLWNQFSSMRGKLKEFDANAVFKAKGNVAGYMELQMNDDGSIKNILEGGIAAGFNAGASVRAPLWWIVYSEFGIGGSVDGKLYLTSQNTKAITAKGEIGLAIKPSIALGADVVIADVKGGLEGTIAGKVTFPWHQFNESVYAYMTGKLFIKVDTVVPGLSGEFPYNFPKMELYPNLGNVTRDFSALQYSAPEPISSQMVKKMSKNSRNAVDTTRESLVYENAKPEMTGLTDGQILMTYLDDTSGQAKLSYRFYDGGQWSESKTVWSGGNLDTAGYLYQHNGSAYVIFESSSRKITEDMTAEQIAGVMELYAAKLSGDRFEEPVKLGTSGTWKYAYQLTEHDGNLCAVWAENSENDIMLQSGETVVYESRLNGTWQEPSRISNTGQVLTETVSGTVGGSFVTAYIKDGQIYIKDQLLDIISAGEKADSLRIQDGTLYARIDGVLYAYDGEQLKAKNVECTASYQVYGNTVYWIQQNNFKSEVLSQSLGSEANPVAITDEGGYVGGFTMVQNAGGKPVFAYTYQPVDENAEGNPYGATILKYTEDITRYQAEVANVAYDILSLVPGEKNPVHVTICNTGTEDLSQVQLVISDRDKVLYSGKVAESLKAGESKECEIAVKIPEDFSKADLSFALTADQQFKKETAEKYELEYCDADIEVTENNIDEIAVKNNSQTTASNVTVILRNQDENGAEIRKIPVGNLKSGESKIISIKEDWKKVTEYMYCKVTQDADEYELWNNSLVMEKQGNSEGGGGGEEPDVPDPSDTSKQIEQITSSLGTYEMTAIKSSDKESLTQLAQETDKLLAITNLTDDARNELTAIKNKIQIFIAKIDEAAAAINTDNIKSVSAIKSDNVKLENKPALQNAKADFEKALKDNPDNYTDAEKNTISSRIAEIDQALQIIGNAEKVINLINALPDADKITASDADAVKGAQTAYQVLTAYEKTLITAQLKSKLDASADALKNVDANQVKIEQIAASIAQYDISSVTSSDREAIDQLSIDINKLLSGDLTDDGRKNLTDQKDKVQMFIKMLDDVASAINTDNIKAAAGMNKDNVKLENKSAIQNAKSDFEKALKAYPDNYTDSEKESINCRIKELNDALKAIENAEIVIDRINALPDPDKLTASDAASVSEAETAYRALAVNEKEIVDTQTESKLEKAVDAIKKINQARIRQITDKLDNFRITNIKSSDQEEIVRSKEEIDAMLTALYLADDDITALNGLQVKCDDLLARISSVAALIDQLLSTSGAYDEKTVKSTDQEALRQLAADIDLLTGTESLTEEEISKLAGAKNKAQLLIKAIEEIAASMDTEQIKAVEGITKDNVRLEDKEALKKAKKDLEEALEKNQDHYTTAEQETLRNRIEEIENALKTIENVEKAIDLINALPGADKITAADAETVKEAKAAYDALTEHAKTLAGTDIKAKLDASEEALKTADKEQNPGQNTGQNPGQDTKKDPVASAAKVSQISLTGISKKIAAGKKVKLTANIIPANAANKALTWTSSNKKVAAVNSAGVVTMKKKSGGKSVTITATARDGSGAKAVYKIKSMKGAVKKVTISGRKSVKAGKTLKLKAKVTAAKGANKKLKWTSSNTTYATVSGSGKVKALKAGRGKKVKITAMATDGSGKKRSITVKIN